jgi:branched-chain amino acid transport system substrate-binding protein
MTLRLSRNVLVGAFSLASCCGSDAGRRPADHVNPKGTVEPLVEAPPAVPFDGTIPIASIFPAFGRYALSGIQSQNGARMAVDDINRRGGVRGRSLTLVEYQTGSYFVDARLAAKEAESHSRVLAFIGSNASSLSKAIAEVAESDRVVQVSNVSTAQDLTWDPTTGSRHPFVFRVCNSDVVLGRFVAEFAKEHLHAHRVAVLYEVGRTYSAQLARSFVEHFRDPTQYRLTAEFYYLPLETDFRNQLKEVASFGADVLFVPGSFTDATLVATQARRLGVSATLLGGDAWSSHLLFKRGGPIASAYYVNHCFPSRGFLETYRRRYAEEAEGCRAILAYDAVQAVGLALGSLGPLGDEDLRSRLPVTRARLRDALAALRFGGQTGPIRFDEHGDASRGAAITEVLPGPSGRYLVRPYLWLGVH